MVMFRCITQASHCCYVIALFHANKAILDVDSISNTYT